MTLLKYVMRFWDYILALMLFPVVCCNGQQGLKMDWNLGQQQHTKKKDTKKIQVMTEKYSQKESES